MKRSKKYKEVLKLLDKKKLYSLDEALELLPKISTSKFDSAVEVHINFNLNQKQKKTANIKGSLILPNQVGTSVKIAVITTPDHSAKAKGAEIVGGEELIKKIEDGWNDFDILIATPDIMPKLAMLGKVLGPKGKMPNPKNNTVTTDLKGTIESYKKGKTDFKVDKQGGLHQLLGKVNMKKGKLKENVVTFLKAILNESRNINVIPFKTVYLSPSMGPSIKLDVKELIKDLT